MAKESLIPALILYGKLSPEEVRKVPSDLQGEQADHWVLDQGLVSTADYLSVTAAMMGLEYLTLNDVSEVDPALVDQIPGSLCRQYRICPLYVDGETLKLAMSDPSDMQAQDDVRAITGLSVKPVVMSPDDMDSLIGDNYRADSDIRELSTELVKDAAENIESDDLDGAKLVAGTPLVKFVQKIIDQAVQDRASDIHVEPGRHELIVRYRIDGVLKVAHRAPTTLQDEVIRRLKIMAGADPTNSRVPQDGRIAVTSFGKPVTLRFLSMPTNFGEMIVLRVLRTDGIVADIRDLKFSKHNMDLYQTAFQHTHGMIVVTGPTGSGKSTTLSATINSVKRPEVNIITIEDPIEYEIPGVNQVPVNTKSGMTFASVLRSIMRADPDIILVGEIRDKETARTAIDAAQTGHLVFSTLHTNDAPSAFVRLIQMGIPPYLVASSLICVVAQRLARGLCGYCKRKVEVPVSDIAETGIPLPPNVLQEKTLEVYEPVGCDRCAQTGFRGRLALQEVLPITQEVAEAGMNQADVVALREAATKAGMTSMLQDGVEKALLGETTFQEVVRVTLGNAQEES